MSEKFYKEKYLKYKKKYLELKQSSGAANIALNNMRRQREQAEKRRREENEEKEYQKLCQENETKWKEEIINLTNTLQNANCDNIYTNKIKNGNKCKNLNNERDIFHNSFVNKVNKCTNDNLNHFNELFILGVKETDYNKQKEINKTIYDMYDNYLNFNDQHRVDARDKTLYLINKLKILDPTVSCDKLKEIKNEYLYELKNKIELNKTVITNGDYENLLKLHKEKMNTQKCTIMSNLPSLPSLPTSLTNLLSSKK